MNALTNHLNATFSQTSHIMTNGQFYLCLLVIAAIFAGAALITKYKAA